MDQYSLRAWQSELLTKLQGPPDGRSIYWYWEEAGNVGKSWMATFLARNHKALTVSTGKTADIAYMFQPTKIVVFDISRAIDMDHVNFSVMEDILNGRLMSSKYMSCVKYFDSPHVVVFANAPPPHGKFSLDRLQTTHITSGMNVVTATPSTPSPPMLTPPFASCAPGFVIPDLRSNETVPETPLWSTPPPHNCDMVYMHKNGRYSLWCSDAFCPIDSIVLPPPLTRQDAIIAEHRQTMDTPYPPIEPQRRSSSIDAHDLATSFRDMQDHLCIPPPAQRPRTNSYVSPTHVSQALDLLGLHAERELRGLTSGPSISFSDALNEVIEDSNK